MSYRSALLGLLCLSFLTIPILSYAQEQPMEENLRAQQENAGGQRTTLYLFSLDFPPAPFVQSPSPPTKETRFWQLLDREMTRTNALMLTDNPDQADYRVELRCGGIFNCSKLLVDIRSPKRVVLSSFVVKNIANFGGLGSPRLEYVALNLTQRLNERINQFAQGGYGHTD